MLSISPYYNLRAEKAVIASMAKADNARKHINRLLPEDFYDDVHARIYRAMQSLFAEKGGIDTVLLAETLTRLYGNDELMVRYIEIIRTNIGIDFLLEEHISLITEAARRREIRKTLSQLEKQLDSTEYETDAVLAGFQDKLRSYVGAKTANTSLQSVLMNAFSELEGRAKGMHKGMPSGLSVLDAKTAGFHKGEMTIIGARPAVGKSALAGQIALSAAGNGNKVCICSREMTDVQYGIRMLARGTTISNAKIRSGKLGEADWDQLVDSIQLYANHDIRFMFDTKYIEDLRAEVVAIKEEGGLDMLIVDYIQLLQSKHRFEKEYQRIGYISKMLKDMSTELNIAVIALAQVGRSTEGSMPTLSELRGSGDLEQDADNVLFLHRPEKIDDRWVKPSDRGIFEAIRSMKQQYIVINIAKHRQGETCAMSCVFNPSAMEFKAVKGE